LQFVGPSMLVQNLATNLSILFYLKFRSRKKKTTFFPQN